MITKKTESSILAKNNLSKMEKAFHPLLKEGIPLYLTRGLAKKDLDALYVIAYNDYSEQKYQEALNLFMTMFFYNHLDKRGWIGAAACCQMLHRYKDAVLYYSRASLIDGEDPLPIFHAAECCLALKKNDVALSVLEALLLIIKNKSVEFAHLKNWASKMKEVLKS
jgi:type III secretion system low calcium response chaperone LcrH/SycD